MKRDADVITGYANPSGSGAGNWTARRHISEQPIGHLQHFERRGGRRLQLARYRPFIQAEPWTYGWRDHLRDVGTILAPLAVLLTWGVAFWLYFAIASASQVPPP